MPQISRAARSDRAAVEALCLASVGPDDYVPMVLDEFLRTGVVLLAEDRGRAVGIMVYHDVPDGSAWLHAARTHPDHRREGIATALMARCESTARRRHRRWMRLWASADNVASVTANARYGFRERARFTRLRAVLKPRPSMPQLEPLTVDARAWNALRDSRILRLSAGYLYHDFYFLRADRTNLRRLAGEEALWRLGSNGFSLSAGYQEIAGRSVQFQPLFGDLSALLRAAPTVAASRGADRVEVFLPHRADVLAAGSRAGFRPMEWGQEAILFEKSVPR